MTDAERIDLDAIRARAEVATVLGSIIGAQVVSFDDDAKARELLGWEPTDA